MLYQALGYKTLLQDYNVEVPVRVRNADVDFDIHDKSVKFMIAARLTGDT